MQGLSPRSATWLFVGSILVLAMLAYISDHSASQYAASEAWVSHTREVETQLALLQAEIARASRRSYQDILLGKPEPALHQQADFAAVRKRMTQVQRLTADNPLQQHNFDKLQPLIEGRITILQQLPAGAERPTDISAALRSRIIEEGELAIEVNGLIQEMQNQEEALLNARQQQSTSKYVELRVILAGALLLVLMLLIAAFRGVQAQLQLRTTAEQTVRKLSSHILRAQDDERRRLSRELHDSIGQLFAGLDMELGSLGATSMSPKQKEDVERCRTIVAQGLSETRTISHLLHPPTLDELGFEHAAKWYVEGFSERSKIQTEIQVSQPFARLNPDTELVLYRFIQEALTNVHRHSGSTRAKIKVEVQGDRVIAEVRDFGIGISSDVLQTMQESSAGSGVGLGGMRERAAALGGELRLGSGADGTIVVISIPLRPLSDSGAIAEVVSPEHTRATEERREGRKSVDDSPRSTAPASDAS